MKNVLIFVLSPFGRGDREPNEFTDITGKLRVATGQTNETCLKYLMWKLEQAGKKLDRAFAFVSPEGLTEGGDFDRIKQIFPALPMEHIELPKGLVQDAMATIPKMHDKLVEYRQKDKDKDIRISVDITGGFRHASMMMLSLTQLLRYSGFKIGEVLYANQFASPKVVEEVPELLDFTSLIGGAEEFVTFGSVKQLQNYFCGNEPPLRIRNLLARMAELSETLRVCGSYATTREALESLSNALEIYEEALKKGKGIEPQELYFSKLLPRIRQEYSRILPQGSREVTPVEIIHWCLHRGLLQQAVTFYAEWLPRYLVESRKIWVNDKELVKECRQKGYLWSHWSIFLFRGYQPNIPSNYNKPEWRRQAFEYLLQQGIMTTTIPTASLLDFVERYEMFVGEVRNQFAHANADDGTVQGQEEIIEAIEESLEFIAGE